MRTTLAPMLAGTRILIAPLDWGLGHAARCIPIVRALIGHGAVPVIAADGGAAALLREEFPSFEHIRLPGVQVRYAPGADQRRSMVAQFPRVVRGITREHSLLQGLKHELHLNAIISDQRFGLYDLDLPSVLITHQLFPFTPMAQGALRWMNRRYIARFQRCWVMDSPYEPGLAGALAHGSRLPENARYIGTHSRFSALHDATKMYDVVAVISGPEPHRRLFEERLLEQLVAIEGRHLLVQGLPAEQRDEQRRNVRVVGHLPALELGKSLSGARLIVSRSGYTTLMDLDALGRGALIVPTPGQTEQEYLARLHGGTGRFIVQQQDRLDIAAVLRSPPAHVPSAVPSADLLERALQDLATLIR